MEPADAYRKAAFLERRSSAAQARKEAEYARRMYRLANCMTDAIAVIDRCGKISFWNRKAEKMFGYKNREIVGRDMHRLILSGLQRNFHRVILKKILRSQKGVFRGKTIEMDVRRRDGSIFPVELTLSGTNIEDRWYLIGIFRDLSWRRKAEKELRESEDKFRNLAENLPNMIFINKGGRIVYANAMCEELMGYTRAELYSPAFDFRKLIAPESRSAIYRNYGRPRKGRDAPPFEYIIITKDGRRLECIITTRFINYERGSAVLGIVTDITARKKAEAETRRAKVYMERSIASLDEVLCIIDSRTYTIMMCNPAVERVLGYKPQELIGKNTAILHVDDRHCRIFRTMLMSALKKYRHFKTEYELKRKDGSIIPTEHTITSVVDEHGRRIGFVSVVHDISARKKAEERMAQYQKQLKTLASALSSAEERERHRLAEKLHDYVGQTLALAKIRLGWLKENIDGGKKQVVNDVRRMIEQSIDHVRSLTFELSPPLLHEVGLEAALGWLIDETEKRSGLKIKMISDGMQKPMSDEVRIFLFNAINGLLTNVIKHARARQVLVSVKWRADDILITVKDDGRGFSPALDKKVKIKGYGLFSIRERLDICGGDLKIDSQPGKGAKISIRCPLRSE